MNKQLRRKDRAVTDIHQIIQILDRAKVLHLGLIDDGFPYIVPLHYGYIYDGNAGKLVFYMHGAKQGHKLDLIERNPNVCIELETDIELHFAESIPCQYSAYYSSIIGQGRASVVEDVEEKKRALKLLMANQAERDFAFTAEMASAVAVIRVDVTDYTAKAKRK